MRDFPPEHISFWSQGVAESGDEKGAGCLKLRFKHPVFQQRFRSQSTATSGAL
jgi:hypothetical protein